MKSLQRKLDRVLYLLVKKPRKEYTWQLPQGGLEQDESLVEV
jgi:large subunit ribosomal protein L46